MVISHNIAALNTYGALGRASKHTDKSMEKLSSGFRINRAGDDAAGLSISEKMRAQIRGLNKATRNAEDGVSMIQTAEGALNETHSILQRMRELAVQSANDTNENIDREALQNEMDQLTSEINRIGNTTEFNNMKLLDGSKANVYNPGEKVVKGGKIESLNAAAGVTNNKFVGLKDNAIIIGTNETVDFTKLQGAADVNTITITENGTKDGFTVDIALVEAKGTGSVDGIAEGVNKITVDSEAMVKNDDGSFSYDNHGISFTITKEDAEKMFGETGAAQLKVDLGLSTTHGVALDKEFSVENKTIGVSNDYEECDITLSTSNIELFSPESRVNYSKANVSFEVGADSSTLTVDLQDADGTTVVKDVIELEHIKEGVGTTYTYSANGLKFDIKSTGAVADGEKMIFNLDFAERFGTEETKGTLKDDNSAYFHVGANKDQTINLEFNDMRAYALGIVSKTSGVGFSSTKTVTDGTNSETVEYSLDISTRAGANSAIETINNAIKTVSAERSKYGAVQNRLEYTVNNLQTAAENMQAAESRIRDVDMASEMMEMTKNSILQQAAQAMLIQANQRPQQALQLLQ